MTKDIYIFDISRATSASDIHSLILDASADITLTPAEQEEVKLYGNRRFAQLNAQAAPAQKPRWP